MRWIHSAEFPPYIIAEAGASHDGDLTKAKRLVWLAASAGCNAVKFQYFKAERLVARRHADGYIENYRKYEVPLEWLPTLARICESSHLDLVLSVYDEQGLHEAQSFAKILKIASFENSDQALIAAACGTGKPVIVSTGMLEHEEMTMLADWRNAGSTPRALLHCVSAYPCPLASTFLSMIETYDLDGFSDHSAKVYMGGLAVSQGASVLEVHCKLDETRPDNPDAPHSLRPILLDQYVEQAREAALAIGPKKRMRYVGDAEASMSAYKVRG